MTQQQKENLFYLTQYANYMTDEGFYNTIAEQVKMNDLDIELFIEIAEMMPAIPDAINQKLFNKMLEATSDADLQLIIDILTAVDNEDLNELNKLTNYALDDYMSENNILSPELWKELADEDLKSNGINANCLSWVTEIDHNRVYACQCDYLQLNGYENGFYNMDDADVIHEFMEYYL